MTTGARPLLNCPPGRWRNVLTGDVVDGGRIAGAGAPAAISRSPSSSRSRTKQCIHLKFGLRWFRALAVKVNDSLLPMQGPDEHGWWRLRVDDAGPGTDYGFQVNGEDRALPDPRSLWQPNGVHGLSRVYDQRAFSMERCRLSAAARFPVQSSTNCTLGHLLRKARSIRRLLSWIISGGLGITHVELMPVAAFRRKSWLGLRRRGAVRGARTYGGPDALKRFVDAAHARGLAVLLDVVYNHFGPSGNYAGKFGPYITDAHQTPWGGAVNLEGEWAVRSAPILLRQRVDVDARFSHRRPAPGRGACLRRSLRNSFSGATCHGDTLARSARGPGQGPDRRKRFQRSPHRNGTARRVDSESMRNGAMISTTRSFRFSIAARLEGYYVDFGSFGSTCQSDRAHICLRWHLFEAQKAHAWKAAAKLVAASIPGLHPEPRPGGQSRGRRTTPGEHRL